ncbi:hypothetical protein LM602_02585 [Candidatus Acetothermia bacterium]|jgi:hypothetical protein|nr:hypothetical protein [Candidatus Acetothermia bacterium]MCI2431430.1 hypothetical protein [Candidatus Acetothermia bacterium]MCI2436705.1 hypothetical protein [Candidatus Acetothermia bacterium]
MELFQEAARQGWTGELKERFVHTYDRQIGRWVLHLLAQYGLICSTGELSALRKHVEARLRGEARDGFSPLVDVLSDVYTQTYHEVFRERSLQKLSRAGAEGERYLFGIVRHQFFTALGREDLSERELLDRMVQSKRPQTQARHLREAKARLWERARAALLSLPVLEPERAQRLYDQVHKNIDALTHYFFERFLPEQYARSRGNFNDLLEDFRREYYRAEGLPEEILSYRAQLPRRPRIRFVGELEATELEATEGVAP